MLVKRSYRQHPHLPFTNRQVFPHILRNQGDVPERINAMSSSKLMRQGYRLIMLKLNLRHYTRKQSRSKLT